MILMLLELITYGLRATDLESLIALGGDQGDDGELVMADSETVEEKEQLERRKKPVTPSPRSKSKSSCLTRTSPVLSVTSVYSSIPTVTPFQAATVTPAWDSTLPPLPSRGIIVATVSGEKPGLNLFREKFMLDIGR